MTRAGRYSGSHSVQDAREQAVIGRLASGFEIRRTYGTRLCCVSAFHAAASLKGGAAFTAATVVGCWRVYTRHRRPAAPLMVCVAHADAFYGYAAVRSGTNVLSMNGRPLGHSGSGSPRCQTRSGRSSSHVTPVWYSIAAQNSSGTRLRQWLIAPRDLFRR